MSLRTKNPTIARTRFAEVEQILTRHWSAVRNGPIALSHKQGIALAGEVYRRWVEVYETDPDMTPDRFDADMQRMDADVDAWRHDPSDV